MWIYKTFGFTYHLHIRICDTISLCGNGKSIILVTQKSRHFWSTFLVERNLHGSVFGTVINLGYDSVVVDTKVQYCSEIDLNLVLISINNSSDIANN